jgi:hypothetical protein
MIEAVARSRQRTIDLVVNEENSGSAFKQWRKGVERARGEYVWLAEADDDCDKSFLEALVTRMVRDKACMGFADSWQVDTDGVVIGDSYKWYANEYANGAFDESFSVDGKQFLRDFLSIKNVILNVSSVVFRKDALLRAFDLLGEDLYSYKVAGDWRLYATICNGENAIVSYEAQPLNGHRRHKQGITQSLNKLKHFAEIRGLHELTASQLPLGEETLERRVRYLEHVREYLQITREELDGEDREAAPAA